jgi:hypothetical protein
MQAGQEEVYHEPLVTYYLSAAALQLQPASQQQHPATHVVRLPLAALAPLTTAVYMPSDPKELSSRGYETYMVHTAEFFKVSSRGRDKELCTAGM